MWKLSHKRRKVWPAPHPDMGVDVKRDSVWPRQEVVLEHQPPMNSRVVENITFI